MKHRILYCTTNKQVMKKNSQNQLMRVKKCDHCTSRYTSYFIQEIRLDINQWIHIKEIVDFFNRNFTQPCERLKVFQKSVWRCVPIISMIYRRHAFRYQP